MIPLNLPALLVILAIGVGYEVAPPLNHAFHKLGHGIVHVVTLGKK